MKLDRSWVTYSHSLIKIARLTAQARKLNARFCTRKERTSYASSKTLSYEEVKKQIDSDRVNNV